MRPPIRVVFSTSVFEDTSTGPATYAQALWQAFSADDEVEFHLVAPAIGPAHPRLHASGYDDGSSLGMYRALARRTLEVALQRDGTLIHANAAHSGVHFCSYPGGWIAQVNDYEVANVLKNSLRTVKAAGSRRLASLLWRHWAERKVVNATNMVVCNSEFTRRTVGQRYGVDESKTVVIYPTADLRSFARPDRLPLDPFPDRPKGARMVFVGSDWRRKGLLDLFAALSRVVKVIPHAHLLVGGPSDEESLCELLGRIAELGLKDSVHLAGRIPRTLLPAVHIHSDLFVLPTHGEALGMAIVEAMAAGLPVVATNVGGIPEIIRSERDGELVPAGNIQLLANAIQLVLMDRDRRAALSAAGQISAGRFGVEDMIAAVKSVYRKLATGEAA